MISHYWKVFLLIFFLLKNLTAQEDYDEIKKEPVIYGCSNEEIIKLESAISKLNATTENINRNLETLNGNIKKSNSVLEVNKQCPEKGLDEVRLKELLKEFKKEIVNEFNNKIDSVHHEISNAVNSKPGSLSTTEETLNEIIEKALEKNFQSIKDFIKSLNQNLSQPLYPTTSENKNPTTTDKHLLQNCAEALKGISKCQDGLHLLSVNDIGIDPFYAYCKCDSTNSEASAWTVIQRRKDGSTDFSRNWEDYENGFGDLDKNFWLGLKYLHAMTSKQNYELLIEMEDWEGEKRYANYDKFSIGNKDDKYRLRILGIYNGNVGDSFMVHKGKKFTTKDSDNDERGYGNCAEDFKGGWWYGDCHVCNPNGVYNSTEYGVGINWKGWHGYKYSLKFIQMSIRPKMN